jgi:mannosyltransferase OCH1-like enzyme
MENLIHLVWLGSNHDQSVISNIKKINNNCNIKLWLDNSILHSTWEKTYNKFAVTYQMKSDLLRLSALRKFGGLYIDFDCMILKPISDIISNWKTLTIPTLGESTFFMGDIIYCPIDWPYWNFVDNYIENFNSDKLTLVTFGHFLFSSLPQHTIQPVIDTNKFPSSSQEMSEYCLIRRYPLK